MPTIKKTKHGSWETYLYLGADEHGKKVKKHLCAKTKKELEKALLEAMRFYNVENVSEMDMTVIDCVERYIKRKSSNSSPKTIREYTGYMVKFPELHNVKLKNLTESKIQEAIDKAAVGHSPKSVQNWWGLFKASITYYYRNFNPRIEMPKKVKPQFDMPEAGKLSALLEHIRGTQMEIPILLACFCGLRRGEIACLDVNEDIVYEYGNKGYVKVTKDMVQTSDNSWVVKEPKTPTSIRNVPIPDEVLMRIEEKKNTPKFYMPSPNGISSAWNKLAKKFDINCSFHGLRHYFASLMAAENIPMKYQRNLLGHTTDSMTMRYQEYLKEQGVAVNEQLANRINSVLANKQKRG